MKNRLGAAGLAAILASLCCNLPKEHDYLEAYLKNMPAVELRKINSIPKENIDQDSGFLVSPRKIEQDGDGNIYIADVATNHLLKFSIDGKLIRTIGSGGQAPGSFNAPKIVDIADNFLMVYDMYNSRVQYFTLDGDYSDSFNVFKGFQALAANSNGAIYAVPLISPFEKDIKLIDVMTKQGLRKGSFGSPLEVDGDVTITNMGRIDISSNGDIYFAFQHYPEVLVFSSEGALLRKCYLMNSEFERRKKSNISNLRKSLQKNHKRLHLSTIVDEIRVTKRGFMILKNAPPFLEIIEYDTVGTLLRTNYWIVPSGEQMLATDFSYWEDRERELFFILSVYPEPKVYVLSPIKEKEGE